MINNQEITKPNYEEPLLRVHSIFYTIQGEGPFSGRPALFIRFAGCNLRCHWCDTDYTGHTTFTTEALVSEVALRLNSCAPDTIVVITGGEPMAQNISPLVRELASVQIPVQIESNGTACPPDFPWTFLNVHVVISPKTGKLSPLIKQHLVAAWKYVIGSHEALDEKDGLPFESTQVEGKRLWIARPSLFTPTQIYISPLDEKDLVANKTNRALVTKLALKHGYNVSLQIHKILEVE